MSDMLAPGCALRVSGPTESSRTAIRWASSAVIRSMRTYSAARVFSMAT